MPPYVRRHLREEQVSASTYMAFIPNDRALPRSIDDAERDFGMDIWDRMRNDPYLEGPLRFIEALVLEDGVPLGNPIPEPGLLAEDEEHRLYDAGQEICDFCVEVLDELDEPIEQTVESLMRAMSHGFEIGELTYRLEGGGRYDRRLVTDSIRMIPHENYVLVATPFNRLLGALAIKPGKSAALYSGVIPSPETHPGYIGREKMVHVTFRRPAGALTGWSLIRSAYDAWKRCQIVKPIHVARLAQFGGESLVVTGTPLSQDIVARPRTMSDGTTQNVDYADWVADRVAAAYKSGGVAVALGDMKLMTVGAAGEGSAFKDFFADANREKMVAVLTSARVLAESERNSQADADKAENVADVLKKHFRSKLGAILRRQVLRPLVSLNYGEDAAKLLTPTCMGSTVGQPDLSEAATAFAALRASGGITDPMVGTVVRRWFNLEHVPGETAEPETEDEDSGDEKPEDKPGKKRKGVDKGD